MRDHEPKPSNGEAPAPAGSPHRWKKGDPSPNKKGRPRSGLAFAEMVRARVDPALVIDLALRLANDETVPVSDRLAALLPLIDRGYLRPPTTSAMLIEHAGDTRRDLSAIPIDQRRAMLALIKSAPRLAPGNTDEDSTNDT